MLTAISTRVSMMKQSAAILVDQKVRELTSAGKDVIGLGTGEPDFDTPDNIKKAAVEAIAKGRTKYTTVDGILPLKQAIVRKFQRENGLRFDVSQISVSSGGKQVIANAFAASVNPGDEVIIPAPYWVSYPDMAMLWGAKPVLLECPQSSGFKLQPQQLADAITDRTRWVIINSPGNPSGAVYSADELRALATILRSYPHVSVMSDDIYEHIIFDGARFATMGEVVPDLQDRILIVNGVSKAYCMTGWRIGYGAGPTQLIQAMAKVQGQTTTHPASISQEASIEALDGRQNNIEMLKSVYQRRRNLVLESLATADISCRAPEGAFYVYPSCANAIDKRTAGGYPIKDDEEFALALLEAEGVAVVQGSAFGMSPHFRMSIATSDEKLIEGCKRIGRFVQSLT